MEIILILDNSSLEKIIGQVVFFKSKFEIENSQFFINLISTDTIALLISCSNYRETFANKF